MDKEVEEKVVGEIAGSTRASKENMMEIWKTEAHEKFDRPQKKGNWTDEKGRNIWNITLGKDARRGAPHTNGIEGERTKRGRKDRIDTGR